MSGCSGKAGCRCLRCCSETRAKVSASLKTSSRAIAQRRALHTKNRKHWNQPPSGPATDAHYARQLAEQEGRCAICGDDGRLDRDHDHSDGRLRGLLCRRCNMAIGQLRESVALLRAAEAYLAFWETP